MTQIDAIHRIITDLGHNPPTVNRYANGLHVAIRNGDGVRVAMMLDYGMSEPDMTQALHALAKLKASNHPSAKAMAKFKSMAEIVEHKRNVSRETNPETYEYTGVNVTITVSK